ncbi:MAG TPA: hypothetical protein DEO32_01730 [Ruminococcaceae bacterium]|nr:hypothetical protein [Oscillospiraceae bacterium]
MFTYYTVITLISIASLLVLCVLVHENGRIRRKQKTVFYLTYLFIGLAALAEWTGIQLNGNQNIPQWLLIAVKCTDYLLTPLTGGALVKQINVRNRGLTVLNGVLLGNIAFQIIAAFFGWMTQIDSGNNYRHGPLYFVYIIIYLVVISVVVVEFFIYGKGFARQNRHSLYAIMCFVLCGILVQEICGGEFRTAYLTMTIGVVLLFIHYVEYAQLDAEDRLSKQEQLLYKDTMTGLYSRHAYSNALKVFDAKGALPEDLVAFSVDINGLKTVNDTMGHAAGDELICGAADCIQRVFGAYGKCYRTGGDEFIVLARGSREKAEALLKQLATETEVWSGKLIHNLSVSAGYALVTDHAGITAEKLIIFADKGMYEDKSRFYRQSGNEKRVYSFAYNQPNNPK